MPYTVEARPDGSPETIEFQTARAGALRAQSMLRLMRRLWGAIRRRPADDPNSAALRVLDIDRLGEALRQPLTSIRSLSELLQENPDLPREQQARMLDLIVEETKRLNRLIGQCLDLVAEAGVANDRYSDRDRRGAA
jgi:signal transduction histidine kinase